MATQPSDRVTDIVYSDIFTAAKIPTHLRKQGIDENYKLNYITRDISKFNYFIHSNFPTAGSTPDRTYRTRELMELNRFYTVQGGTGQTWNGIVDTNHKQVTLTNSDAAELKVNQIMMIKGTYIAVSRTEMVGGQVYAAVSGVQGTNIGPDLNNPVGANPTRIWWSKTFGPAPNGSYYTSFEQIKLIAKGEPDSGGVGFTLLTFDRCFQSPSEHDIGGRRIPTSLVYSTNGVTGTGNGGTGDGAGAPVYINRGDILLRGTTSFAEGTNAPTGLFKWPTEETNFIQEYKYAVEQTLESKISEKQTWIGDDVMTMARWLTTRIMNRDMEYTYLFGKKLSTIVGGKEEYVMGGVQPFILEDALHYIQYLGPTITWPGMLDMGKQIFGLGGSTVRTGFTGITADAELRKSFWNTHLFYNAKDSKAFDMEVNTLHISGGQINLISSQVMEESGYGNKILCLDFGKKDAFEPVVWKGMGYQVDTGNGKTGIAEAGSQLYKEQMIGTKGMYRRYPQFHCVLDLSNAIQS